ncbi:GGDEF domain-containing protein [Saccharopolyspora tripterygii]
MNPTSLANTAHVRELVRRAETAEAQVRALTARLHSDPLTGIGNRLALDTTFRRHTGPAAVLMLDLDHFKAINDTYGHRTGDLVLVEVADRLRSLQRPGDLPVRISGDEFALWLGGAVDSARDWAENVALAMAEPMHLGSLHLRVTASVGTGVHRTPGRLEDLLELADHDMYRHKHHHSQIPAAR